MSRKTAKKAKMTRAELAKRSEIAEAIGREHPGYSKARKFKITTKPARRSA